VVINNRKQVIPIKVKTWKMGGGQRKVGGTIGATGGAMTGHKDSPEEQ